MQEHVRAPSRQARHSGLGGGGVVSSGRPSPTRILRLSLDLSVAYTFPSHEPQSRTPFTNLRVSLDVSVAYTFSPLCGPTEQRWRWERRLGGKGRQ